MMTRRQRFQAILDHQVPDRTAWVPRLNIWYAAHKSSGTLPDEIREMSLEEAESYLGMARSARSGSVYTIEYEDVEFQTVTNGDEILQTVETPVGQVTSRRHHSAEDRKRGMLSVLTEPPIKTEKDYAVLKYLAEHIAFVPDYESYHTYDEEIGDDGFPMVIAGLPPGIVAGLSPVHTIMLYYLGYENFYYHMTDHSAKLEELIEIMTSSYKEMWEVVADSPARFVLHGQHFSSVMTPPPIFKKYFMPYFQQFTKRMHSAGIKVAAHLDADCSQLLEMILDCGFDAADCFACAPLVDCTFDQAREAWQDRIVIWGGVPSIILEPQYPFDEFKCYLQDLHSKTDGRSHFIMAVSDNIMPAAEFKRLVWIRDFLKGDLK